MRTCFALAMALLFACSKDPAPTRANTGRGYAGLATCKDGRYVYATGSANGNGPLIRSSAERRARAQLLGPSLPSAGPQVKVKDAELIDVHVDGDTIHALARSTDPSLPRDGLPECDRDAIAWRSTGGRCPAWTRATAIIDGQRRSAVGASTGIDNPDLAIKTATNRARAALKQLGELELGAGGASASGEGPEAPVVEKAECEGVTYVRVEAS